jgi:hypothetical protein
MNKKKKKSKEINFKTWSKQSIHLIAAATGNTIRGQTYPRLG